VQAHAKPSPSRGEGRPSCVPLTPPLPPPTHLRHRRRTHHDQRGKEQHTVERPSSCTPTSSGCLPMASSPPPPTASSAPSRTRLDARGPAQPPALAPPIPTVAVSLADPSDDSTPSPSTSTSTSDDAARRQPSTVGTDAAPPSPTPSSAPLFPAPHQLTSTSLRDNDDVSTCPLPPSRLVVPFLPRAPLSRPPLALALVAPFPGRQHVLHRGAAPLSPRLLPRRRPCEPPLRGGRDRPCPEHHAVARWVLAAAQGVIVRLTRSPELPAPRLACSSTLY